jgi:hypothetical protein
MRVSVSGPVRRRIANGGTEVGGVSLVGCRVHWGGPTEDVYARYYEAFEHFRL